MQSYILSIDQGTTGTTSLIIDAKGQVASKVNEEYRQIFPKPGWVEHHPEEIWQSVLSTIKKAIEEAKIQAHQVKAIGITNQRETVVVWDRKTGEPIYNAIVWQCRRTTEACAVLKKKKKEKMIQAKTGLLLDPYFSATKIQWILKNVPGAKKRAQARELCAGTIDSFLLWRLSGGQSFKTDVSNASRTMLMNLKTLQWDKDLLKLFGIPMSMLPEISPSAGVFGVTAKMGTLPDGVVISGMAGDQQAALFGQSCFSVGEAKCTFGTGSFILMNTGAKPVFSKHRLLTTVAWQIKGQKPVYALEGGAFICGAAVQWLRDGLRIIKSSSEIEALASSVSDAGGVEFVPALTGLGAPHWKSEARGVICGLTRGTTTAHIARATLEAMALQNADVLIAMQKDLKKKMSSIKVDGGAVVNNLLMQMQSDYIGSKVVRPQQIETTALGAAYLAGLGCGFWKDLKSIQQIWKFEREFKSQISMAQRKKRAQAWQKALAKAE